jgi:hypothetical protein
MNHLFATAIFGLAASLCWGSGDFGGGLASRRANAESVVLAAHNGRLDVAAILSSLILGISSSINELEIPISHVVRSVTFAAHLSYTTVWMLAITRAI